MASIDDLHRCLAERFPGEPVKLRFLRDQELLRVVVVPVEAG